MSKWQGFYSASQVSRLAGISKRTLYRWSSKGIISPSVRVIDADGKVEEGYSYADLAIIKVLHALRIQKINLRSAVVTFRHLYQRFGSPSGEGWSNAHVFIVKKDVFAQKPDDWDTTLATKGGQRAEMRVLGDLVEEEGALLVPKEFSEYVEINPDIMDGEPVLRDTRVPTSMLATLKEEGMSIKELAAVYHPASALAIEKAIAFEKQIDETYSKISAKARPSIN